MNYSVHRSFKNSSHGILWIFLIIAILVKKMNFGNITIKQRFYQIITDISYPSLCDIQTAAEFLNLCQSVQIWVNFMVEPK